MTSRRDRSARGQSLVETLLVLALLGVTVVAFTPFQSFVARSLHGADGNVEPAALSWTARHLAADARAALEARIESAAAVRFTMPSNRRVLWTATAGGAVERVEVNEHGRLRKAFPTTSLNVGFAANNLLTATLRGPDGRLARIEVWLRPSEERE